MGDMYLQQGRAKAHPQIFPFLTHSLDAGMGVVLCKEATVTKSCSLGNYLFNALWGALSFKRTYHGLKYLV